MKYVLCTALFAFSACTRNQADGADARRNPQHFTADFDIDQLRPALRIRCERRADTSAAVHQVSRAAAAVAQFYATHDYQPVWTFDPSDRTRIESALACLRGAAEHGIDPALYGLPALEGLVRDFYELAGRDNRTDYDLLAEIEFRLSQAMASYAGNLRSGIINPKRAYPDDYFLPVKPSNGSPDLQILAARDPAAYLRTITPHDSRTVKLEKALAWYRELERTGPLVQIPAIGSKLEPGKPSTILGMIDRRVRFLDQFRLGAPAPPKPESSFTSTYDGSGPRIYDNALVEKVKAFQRNRGLLDDGVIGDRTIAAMNRPISEYIRQITLNLERFRWTSLPDSGRFVHVNVPDFYLTAYQNGSPALRMKVCCGMRGRNVRIKGQEPVTYQTPIVSGKLSYLVLNPTWSVPPSIAVRETYFEALKDSTYLMRHGYKVMVKDSVVRSSSIKWKNFDPKHLPFRFIQDPGEGNALGKIKFVFDNAFDIYLHDTPKRKPFTYATRAVSHGCIRIEEPMRMMDFLLKGHSKWTPAMITDYLSHSRVTKSVFLDQKVPVYVDYYTAWVDDNGVLQLRDDVYGIDRAVRRSLDAVK